jgi:5-methylcytosine-specific restriction endonuclease McrA
MALANAQPKPKLRFHEKRESAKQQADNWKKLRAAVIKRDGLACRVCGVPRALDLHHILMKSLGGRDEASNVCFVCRDCHKAIHGHALKVRWTDDTNRAKTARFEWV